MQMQAIIEVNYEYWITENELDVDIEDFRLQVDMRYRVTLPDISSRRC